MILLKALVAFSGGVIIGLIGFMFIDSLWSLIITLPLSGLWGWFVPQRVFSS